VDFPFDFPTGGDPNGPLLWMIRARASAGSEVSSRAIMPPTMGGSTPDRALDSSIGGGSIVVDTQESEVRAGLRSLLQTT
jgi:hypothetical protein